MFKVEKFQAVKSFCIQKSTSIWLNCTFNLFLKVQDAIIQYLFLVTQFELKYFALLSLFLLCFLSSWLLIKTPDNYVLYILSLTVVYYTWILTLKIEHFVLLIAKNLYHKIYSGPIHVPILDK